ncbi:MAG TPA: class I tRNA ligase family protein [Phycisphaerae bacterium]|nr:class I tRNA ligase family protein [Phycisphaerae bacterium]
MKIDLPPQYDPKSVEKPVYQRWLEARVFHAVAGGEGDARKAFSIVIPPPNVTGALHLGHAINGTIQDILTRYHRMKGDNTLWMPGIDHAGIATQAVVEKTIFEKENKSRHDLGREELVRRIWEWKEQFGTRILSQLQSIGASCDWDRTRFTLDDICARAVREAFFKMFKDGLIFRGKRLVNWDTHLQTAVADDEIYHETVKGQMTSIKYPVDGSPDEYLIVATTRPETMLGDTAVAVHPDDERYTHLHGKHVIVPLVGRRIPIITDGLLVDPSFGTGVVKVTPAHDPNDYATGVRHHLEQINLLTPDGKVNEKGSGVFLGKQYSYAGLKFASAARKAVLADLEALGLIAEVKPHEHEVGHSDRSKTPIEPYLSDQWFVRMGDIMEPSPSEPRPSGSGLREQSPGAHPSSANALAYFLTFHTYATWLRGEEPGSVDADHNDYGTPFVAPDPELFAREMANAKSAPVVLSEQQRQTICQTMVEVAKHRGWMIHAVNVRSTHVHAVVSGDASPEKMMNDFKSYATRRLREAELVSADAKVWSRHGSTPYLWKEEDIAGAADYTLHKQGENLSGAYLDREQFAASLQPLPHGRGSDGVGITLANGERASGLAQAAMDAVTDGRVKITPDRYAKGYLDWLGQKRDWCISRQLWWGHRIPVWHGPATENDKWFIETNIPNWGVQAAEGVRRGDVHYGTSKSPTDQWHSWTRALRDDAGNWYLWTAVAPGNPDKERDLEKLGYQQDPDVLDTWFSSALWPISTMGWPATGTSDSPDDQLLHTFYPTSLLSTARDILTLWVARMVMFGLYCKGDVPFRDVYVHAVIQDGEGRTMSKSKGNGVDPVDIINSHGADALRFTLAQMATETQDIRMPVVKDAKTGANTSPKFDIGRNFANKIWNASRFILSNLAEDTPSLGISSSVVSTQHLEDRWILSRLAATIATVESSINAFHFAEVATALYAFFWTDLCDWYLEIAKARIRAGDSTVQSILLHCLETSLKLLHPVMPFITEELWSKLPNRTSLLVTAAWPIADARAADSAAEAQIAIIQSITSQIRDIQNSYPAAKGKAVVLAPRNAATQQAIDQSRTVIESLTGSPIAQNALDAAKPPDAAARVLPDVQIFIGGVIDKAAEAAKLAKLRDQLLKHITGNRNKLGNESFVAKAPAAVLRGLRDQLARQEEELGAVEKNLAELQG